MGGPCLASPLLWHDPASSSSSSLVMMVTEKKPPVRRPNAERTRDRGRPGRVSRLLQRAALLKVFASSLVIGRNNDGHGGLQQTGVDFRLPHNVLKNMHNGGQLDDRGRNPDQNYYSGMRHCGWTKMMGGSPSRDRSRSAASHTM